VKGLRIGIGETVFFDDVDAELDKAVRESGQVFKTLGARLEGIEVPEAAAAWAEKHRPLLIPAEGCVTNRELLDNHLDELDPVIGPRMLGGRSLSTPDYVALLRRYAQLRDSVQRTLSHIDAFIVPTTMEPAWPLCKIDATPESYLDYNMRVHRNTGIGNILNLCAVSLPCGFTKAGLPIGLMVYAKPFQEDMALRVAYAYEQATQWRMRRPELASAGVLD
jgi:aspartyl-tRNA(Asn)/glutamyl-tRNA(Gln) amidotransferase subunit A